MLWVGIDEAGYGPNLGPLVVSAVVAEGDEDRAPDVWADLAPGVSRAGGPRAALWVDDSKRVYRSGQGLARLEAGVMALLAETGEERPTDFEGVLTALRVGWWGSCELDDWMQSGGRISATSPTRPPVESMQSGGRISATSQFVPPDDCIQPGGRITPTSVLTLAEVDAIRAVRPLRPLAARWRITTTCVEVVGPARFNAGLEEASSKGTVLFDAFIQVVRRLWDDHPERSLRVTADKQGGRNTYYDLIQGAFPGLWVDRGTESGSLSRYIVRGGERYLEIVLRPRADQENGLVALASMVAKLVRERWMGVFNAYWANQVPGVKATAGYPVDAARFRSQIEARATELGHSLHRWWRAR